MTRAEVERAFTAHKDAVYRFAWRMAPAAADDIAQEVFLRLLRGQVQRVELCLPVSWWIA